jgi:hypothetical protein
MLSGDAADVHSTATAACCSVALTQRDYATSVPGLAIFICYRRSDTSADAGRLYEALRRRYRRGHVFMDVDSLSPGEDWADAIEDTIGRCDVLLAVIGPNWIRASDQGTKLRLRRDPDRVWLEIETAFRKTKRVIPVLVRSASMPSPDKLPDTLRPLLRRHPIRIDHVTFESDLTHLLIWLRRVERLRTADNS